MKQKLYYGIFFDILGQKDFLAHLATEKQWREGISRFNACFRPFIDQLSATSLWLRDWVKSNSEWPQDENDLLSTLSDRERIVAAKKLDYGIIQFSDSTLLCVEAGNPWTGSVLFHWMSCMATNMMTLRAYGLFIRGAISLGLAYPVRCGQLAGPLIDELARMEKAAFSARIVVSRSVFDSLIDHFSRSKKGEIHDAGLVDSLHGFVKPDMDGMFVLDDMAYMVEDGVDPAYATLWAKTIERCENDLRRAVDHKAWQIQQLKEWLENAGAEYGLVLGGIRPKRMASLESPDEQGSSANYFVLYLRYSRNPLRGKRGYEDMIRRLSVTVNNFRSIQISDFDGVLKVGVEHIGEYLMVYVCDTGRKARERFIPLVWYYLGSIICDMPERAYIRGALSYGRGWKMRPNCLMGPVVGEAHAITEKVAEYPRIVLSDQVLALVRKGEFPMYVREDVDHRYALHYLHPRIAEFVDQKLGFSFKEQYESNLREIYSSGLKLSPLCVSGVTDVALANQLHLLQNYYEDSAGPLGVDVTSIYAKVRSPKTIWSLMK